MRRNPARTILIVAGDLGFTVWAAQALATAKFMPLAAKSVADAKDLIEEAQIEIDVCIIDPGLYGVAEWVETLRARPRSVKVLALADEAEETSHVADVEMDGVIFKPLDPNRPQAATTWVKALERYLLHNSAA